MFPALTRLFRRGTHDHPIDRLAEINGLVSGIALFPQVAKTVSTWSAADLCPWTFGLILANSSVWIAYAVHRRMAPLFVASVLNAAASGVLLGFALTV